MDRAPHRVEIHKEHEIKVWVFADVAKGGFVGFYQIGGSRRTSAAIAGGFSSAQQAQDAAFQSAKDWLDRNPAS